MSNWEATFLRPKEGPGSSARFVRFGELSRTRARQKSGRKMVV